MSYLPINDERFHDVCSQRINRGLFFVSSRPINEISHSLYGQIGNFNYRTSSLTIESGHRFEASISLKNTPKPNKYSALKTVLSIIKLVTGLCHSVVSADKNKTDKENVEFIAFYSGRSSNRDIYRMNVDGFGLMQLTTNTAHDECPSISQDGKKISFLSNRDGNLEIYLMNADSSNQTRITNDTITEDQLSWSPDGTTIYFIRDYSSRTEIWVMSADGSDSLQLTNNQWRDERPVLSK